MWVINKRKIFYLISGLALVLSVVSISLFGLKLSIDFTGGSVLEFNYTENVLPITDVHSIVRSQDFTSGYVLRATGDNGYILKLPTITDEQKDALGSILSENGYPVDITRFNTIGPTLGNELKTKALVALIVLSVAIIIFIAFTFRHVSKPVSSWKYGFIAIASLIHDVVITIGVFSILGKFYGVEVDTLFVTALLVILGYSINDTIVVFDRVRENLKDKTDQLKQARFSEIVGKSLKETFARSFNTSFTTLLSLFALMFIGSEATQTFSLALIVGILLGTYSSIFLAAPMLVSLKNWSDNRPQKKAE